MSTTDRLTLMHTFVRIVERGSISAAARELGMSQATASRHLAQLEERLGTVLVRRTSHDLALSTDGERTLADAREFLRRWDALADRFGTTAALEGTVRVVAPIALGQGVLVQAVAPLLRAHPGLRVEWSLVDGPVSFVQRGCDIWITVGAIEDDRLQVDELTTVERLVVGTGPAAEQPSALGERPAVVLTPFEGRAIRVMDGRGGRVAIRPRVAFSTTDILAALTAVRAGVGFAILPRWLVEDDLQGGVLVDLLPGWRAPSLTIYAATHPRRFASRRLSAVLEVLADAVRGLAADRTHVARDPRLSP
jgi:DNA-binding transcriptional LysR family regulator